MMWRCLVLLPTLLALSGCYLFTDEGRPCDPAGVCLPGYTCVKGLCQKAASKQINEACRATGECVAGAICADAYCDDSAGAACETAADCQPDGDKRFNCYGGQCECKKVCRPGCNFPDNTSCASGQLCWWQVEQEVGFCQEGHCGVRGDGTVVGNCLDNEVCLEFNGPGSGLCNPKCHILNQNTDCSPGPPPQGILCCANDQNCEHITELWGNVQEDPTGELGICFDSGTGTQGATCSPDPALNLYCVRGLVCHVGHCVEYCNLGGGRPECNPGYNCIAFSSSAPLQYGYCRQ
ncbi:MAG: hypothetical protein JXR83_17485 [Deltaproteobacteria bacterium]|nr:hypothetical protein [Deltaproteobacteria bacterium]